MGIPACKMYPDANNPQTINKKDFGLNILNTLQCYSTPRMSLRAVLAASFPPVCLLIENLIEISEGDFNHRGVVRAYLSEPQRKKEFPADAVTPRVQQLCQGEMCLKTHLPFRLCNTCQTAANLTAAKNKRNEEEGGT